MQSKKIMDGVKYCDCENTYCAKGFETGDINGTYSWTGKYYNFQPVYNNRTYYLWYFKPDIPFHCGYWAISINVGDTEDNWVTGKDDEGNCPDGAYSIEYGYMYIGECGSSSTSFIEDESSSSSSSSSSSES